MTHYPLVIVGGGIAGISAAWYAQQNNLGYALLEASNRWGGKIQTETITTDDGKLIVEHGPDSFITQKPWALQLAQQLGLNDQLIGTQENASPVYVLNNGRHKPLPEGMMLIVPTKFAPFATSSLISPLGKLRMGMEALIPARDDDGDESLADFVRRRLGQEALDKLAEPLMSGIYNANAEHQSLMATFPRFRTLEQKYGSLTQGMLAARKARASAPKPANGKQQSIFMSFRNGMETFVNAIVSQLTGDLQLNAAVKRITPLHNGDSYQLLLEDGRQITAEQILLTLPAYATSALLCQIAPTSAAILRDIDYVDTGTVSLAYHKDDVTALRDSNGMVIPRSENRRINAITVSSNKFENRAPDDVVLMRVFYGGARSPQTFAQDNDRLLQTVRSELQDILGITADPIMTRIVRTKQATPQYYVGHLERMAQVEANLPQGISVAGSAYYGVGVPDCVHQSEQIIATLAPNLEHA